jgi:hypothetical protein
MFMIKQSHTCWYCRTQDEAHHKRHEKIAETIRAIYACCNFNDWRIIPSKPAEDSPTNGEEANLANDGERDCNTAPKHAALSKRERKDAKALKRAAERNPVTTHDEVLYVEAIMHPSSSAGDDVDFDAELDRILGVFRITELTNANTRNCGLRGKELKTFHATVEKIKKAIVDDLILVKQDVLETEMRREGFLRYTSKAANSILEERYAGTDWKTGEKHPQSTTASGGIVSPPEEPSVAPRQVNISLDLAYLTDIMYSLSKEDPPPSLVVQEQEPDLRHLKIAHRRVNGDDGLETKKNPGKYTDAKGHECTIM